MAKTYPEFDFGPCMSCGICVQACPFSCLELSGKGRDPYRKAYPELLRPGDCTGCGICAASCPVDAVEMTER